MLAYQKNYNTISKILHKIALGSPLIKRAAFDMDSLACPAKKNDTKAGSPVYITGLARGGTTILLEALYSTGEFVSLTYRDMPFATAPYLWKKISAGFYKNDQDTERSHDDGIKINYDSPEAFEETFWSTFYKNKYIKKNSLEVTEIDLEILEYYKKYVKNIINSRGLKNNPRYLAKNNNNLLRVKVLKKIFPKSIILVPFRSPIDHAGSLLKLHKKFLLIHKTDPFSLKYMNWLGHFEFGRNFKAFNFGDEAIPKNTEELININYWLRYWNTVYKYIIKNYKNDVIFFDYNKYCKYPDKTLLTLKKKINLNGGSLKNYSKKIIKPQPYDDSGIDQKLLTTAKITYSNLLCLAL